MKLLNVSQGGTTIGRINQFTRNGENNKEKIITNYYPNGYQCWNFRMY